MELVIDHLGTAYGQHDYEMRILEEDARIAVLSFSEYRGIPHVNWIEVDDSHARRGLAATMLRNLQGRYPDVQIEFGYTTPEGTALIEGLNFRLLRNPAYAAAKEAAERSRDAISRFQSIADRLPEATEEDRLRLMGLLDGWNEASNMLDEAEEVLAREPEFFRYVDLDEATKDLSGNFMNRSVL
jgi:hypothetical protein